MPKRLWGRTNCSEDSSSEHGPPLQRWRGDWEAEEAERMPSLGTPTAPMSVADSFELFMAPEDERCMDFPPTPPAHVGDDLIGEDVIQSIIDII